MTRTPERYASATSSSHLRVELQPCDIDPIIAAGWVKVGLSTELYRLMVEVDGADQRLLTGLLAGSRLDYALLKARLRHLGPAQRELVGYAHKLRARFPEVDIQQVLPIALAVLYQFLFPVCPECDGRMFQTVPGSPHLSHKTCPVCEGTGERALRVPGGRHGAEFAWALKAGVSSKLQVLFEVMSRHLRNQLDLPIGTKRGNERIAEHCAQVLRDNPHDGAALKVLERAQAPLA